MNCTYEMLLDMMKENSGNIKIQGQTIDSFPDYLTVEGNMDLTGSRIEKMPCWLMVKGDLIMTGAEVKELPESLRVEGNLILKQSNVKRLPKELFVGHSMRLDKSKVETLPNPLNVCGITFVGDAPIASLPEGFVARGALVFHRSKIKKLPCRMLVGRFLDCDISEIDRIPDDLVVGSSVGFPRNVSKDNVYNLATGGKIFMGDDDVSQEIPHHFLKSGDYSESRYVYCDDELIPVKSATQLGIYTFYKGMFDDLNVMAYGKLYTCCKSASEGICKLQARYFSHKKDCISDEMIMKLLSFMSDNEKSEAFSDELAYQCVTDDNQPHKKGYNIAKAIVENDINDLLIALCGWNVESLIRLTEKRIDHQAEESRKDDDE